MNKNLIALALIFASLVLFGSCKPKQSAYKSVYETAKQREVGESNVSSTNTTTATNTSPVATETVRREKITPVYESDASGLKAYSVVVAAMSMKPNAESLKGRLEADGYKVILVQNEQKMYRVIIASCDTKDEASAKKNQTLANFAEKGSFATLKSKYGIPFTDWWILQREF